MTNLNHTLRRLLPGFIDGLDDAADIDAHTDSFIQNVIEAEEYNGWPNRETWALVLHINNVRGLQDWAHDLTAELVAEYGTTAFNRVGERIVDGLEEIVHDGLLNGSPVEAEHGLMILRDVGSFWRIDWAEVGESMIEAIDA